jgi:hypothetical protein
MLHCSCLPGELGLLGHLFDGGSPICSSHSLPPTESSLISFPFLRFSDPDVLRQIAEERDVEGTLHGDSQMDDFPPFCISMFSSWRTVSHNRFILPAAVSAHRALSELSSLLIVLFALKGRLDVFINQRFAPPMYSFSSFYTLFTYTTIFPHFLAVLSFLSRPVPFPFAFTP